MLCLFMRTRELAHNIIGQVICKKQFIESLLDSSTIYLKLEDLNKSFVRNLVSSTFRHIGIIDAYLFKFIKTETNPKIINILRLAICEVLYFRTPHYAIVNTYVELTKALALNKYTSLVNAVLHKAIKKIDVPTHEDIKQNNFLFQLWSKDYGLNTASKIYDALIQEHIIDISVKEPIHIELLTTNLSVVKLTNHSIRIKNKISIKDIPYYNEGYWWVQSAASSLTITLLKNSLNDKKVADVCAAPGGKTFLLDALGAKVTAFEISKPRLTKMFNNLTRLGLEDRVQLIEKNLLEIDNFQDFNIVVLDAPCSCTGTIRKNPEIFTIKGEVEIYSAVKIQTKFLKYICNNVTSGTKILYSVCSLQKAEGEELITKFLKEDSSVRLVPITAEDVFSHQDLITQEGFLRILPYHFAEHGGMEGFFAAVLEKI